MSSATVSLPSEVTSQPGISSDVISKSAAVTVIRSPPRSSVVSGADSTAAICSCVKAAVSAAICFMYLPYFGPRVLKLGLMRLVIRPAVSATSSIRLTLTSFMMSGRTASIWRPIAGSSTGMRIFPSGWRTLMFTLRRRASTIDETRCASDIVSSSSLSASDGSAAGNCARCTEPSWRPLTAFRSRKMRSEMKGAKGALSDATVSRQV